jgi:hypothetical protein
MSLSPSAKDSKCSRRRGNLSIDELLAIGDGHETEKVSG